VWVAPKTLARFREEVRRLTGTIAGSRGVSAGFSRSASAPGSGGVPRRYFRFHLGLTRLYHLSETSSASMAPALRWHPSL
jgi:hypothetical protein